METKTAPVSASVFTRLRLPSTFALLIILAFALSGCGVSNQPIGPESTGWFDHYFVYTFSRIITYFSLLFRGDYGLSIILVTILIRLCLMPLMLRQLKSQSVMQAKMKRLQPELQALQEKYKDKGTDRSAQQAKSQEMMQLYQKHQVNPLAVGCLPALIQMPILLGFYYAIRRTPEIAAHSFLWFNLGHPDVILPFLAAAVYFVQFKVSQIGASQTNGQQQKQMAMMGMLSPIMMGLFSFTAPAALPLYWTVGGMIVVAQTYLGKKLYRNAQ